MKKDLLMMAAMMNAAVDNYFDTGKRYNPGSHSKFGNVKCIQCAHCPKGVKTFCKVAGNSTTPSTNANKCDYFTIK